MDKNKTSHNDCVNCGIKCSVENCVHHTLNDCCTVDTVKIGTKAATRCAETICASFECQD